MSEGGVLRQIAAQFGIEFDDRQLTKGRQSIDAAVTAVKGLGEAFAGSELVRGITEFARSFGETASRIDDVSQRLGISAESLQEFQHAARMGGVQAEELNAALTVYERTAGHALTPERFEQIADSIQQIHDPAQRVQRAVALFGRAGAGMVPVLQDGAAGVRRLRDEFHALGGGIDEDGIRAGAQFGDAMDRWSVASDGLKTRLAVELIPAITKLVEWLTRTVGTIVRFLRGTETIRVALIALGAVLAGVAIQMLAAFAPVIIPVLAAAAAITALVVIVEDFVGFLQGRDSLIGRTIRRFFGEGARLNAMQALRDLWRNVVAWVGQAWTAVQRFWTQFGPAIRQEIATTASHLMKLWSILTAIGGAIAGVLGAIASVVDRIATKLNEITGGAAGRLLSRVADVLPSALAHTIGSAIPISQAITAPLAAVGIGGAPPRSVNATSTINVHGVQNPREVARLVSQQVVQTQRAQLEADHPIAPAD